jgi:MFS family permease
MEVSVREAVRVADPRSTQPELDQELPPSSGSWLTGLLSPGRMTQSLPALQSRDFRLFWFGQMISLTGTWVQNVAQQWLVLKLTGSAFELGLVTTVQFTPLLVLALIGGAIADRLPKRNLLLATQVISALLAVALGVLVRTGTVQYWHILVFAGALGTVNAFYTPARQAFVPELVEKDALFNAVALNSAIFNASRVVGPALGGVLVAVLGLSLNFFLNALSFVAVIGGLLLVRTRHVPRRQTSNILENVREGLAYIKGSAVIYTLLALVGSASLFALNFTTILPLFARYVLHSGSEGFGFLTAASGCGSLVGSIAIAFFSRTSMARLLVYGGCAVLCVGEIAFALSRLYVLSIALLVIVGLAQTIFTTTANTRILSLTPSALQGRVMSVYSLMFLGVTPFGSFLSGVVAEKWGPPAPLILGGAITLAITALIFVLRSRQQQRELARA